MNKYKIKACEDKTEEKFNDLIKESYSLAEEKTAQFVAFLTDSILDIEPFSERCHVKSKERIKELISEAYKEKNYIRAGQLLNSVSSKVEKTGFAEIVSKSVRVRGDLYLQLLKSSYKNNISVADSFKLILFDGLENIINKLSADKRVNKEKLNILSEIFKRWKKQAPSKSPCGEYSEIYEVSLNRYFKKFYEILIRKYCEKEGFTLIQIDKVLQNIEWGSDNLPTNLSISFLKSDKKDADILLSIERDFGEFFIKDCDLLSEEIGLSSYKKLSEWMKLDLNEMPDDKDMLVNMGEPEGILYSYFAYLNVKTDSIMLSNIPIADDHEKEISKKILEELFDKYGIKKVDEVKLGKDIQKALGKGDLETVKKLNSRLEEFDAVGRIADWTAEQIISSIRDSRVITFSLPKLLLNLFDAYKDIIIDYKTVH